MQRKENQTEMAPNFSQTMISNFLTTLGLLGYVQAQGSASNPFPGYSCPSSCRPPSCSCASPNPPVANPPQFFVLTFDDAIQERLIPAANALFGNRRNPNECPVGATWYAQVFYSDPYIMSQWYAQGNEIGDHSV